MKKMVIVTGCGRSGTLYMRKVFEVFGYDVGHEGLRQDGISSWYIVDPHHWNIADGYINKRENARKRERLYIHLVRNPLDVISSFYRCEALRYRASLDFFRRSTICDERWLKFDLIPFIAKYWVEWNKAVKKYFPSSNIIRVEDMQYRSTVRRLAGMINFTSPYEVEQMIGEVHALGTTIHKLSKGDFKWLSKSGLSDRFRRLTFGDISAADRVIAHEVLQMADRFGYDLDEIISKVAFG